MLLVSLLNTNVFISFWISGRFSEPSRVNQHEAQWRSPDANEKIKGMCVAPGLVIHLQEQRFILYQCSAVTKDSPEGIFIDCIVIPRAWAKNGILLCLVLCFVFFSMHSLPFRHVSRHKARQRPSVSFAARPFGGRRQTSKAALVYGSPSLTCLKGMYLHGFEGCKQSCGESQCFVWL